MNQETETASKVSIVYVDDDSTALEMMGIVLRRTKAEVRLFTNPGECLRQLRNHPADIVITDLDMPGISGFSVLEQVKTMWPDTDVIIATGIGDKDSAIKALKLGAYDYFEKPISADDLVASVMRTVRYRAAIKERDKLESQLSSLSEQEARRWGLNAFVGKSPALKKAVSDIKSLQASDRTTVLIAGESGTGKELAAHAIHSGSARSKGAFVAVNCSAIPENLAESIFFGHAKGSFTGASTDRKGSFELADGGTLFLDEIGDMHAAIQAKLLRVLEDHVVEPIGAGRSRVVDVRIIAVTNSDLDRRVAEGKFRTDLFHRLVAFRIHMPSLRERKDDIPLLARHFLKLLSDEMGLAPQGLSDPVLGLLSSYDYPGNVRELKNLIEQALIRSAGHVILPEHIVIPSKVSARKSQKAAPASAVPLDGWPEHLPLNLRELEKKAIKQAMIRTGGNVSESARLLGVGRSKLYRDIDEI